MWTSSARSSATNNEVTIYEVMETRNSEEAQNPENSFEISAVRSFPGTAYK